MIEWWDEEGAHDFMMDPVGDQIGCVVAQPHTGSFSLVSQLAVQVLV